MITQYIKESVKRHAMDAAPFECCGLVVRIGTSVEYIRANNLSLTYDNFILDPVSIQEAEDTGEILAIVHSHVTSNSGMSELDKLVYSKSGYTWIIYSLLDGSYSIYEPVTSTNEVVPLIGRKFFFGVQDCYSIIRDYYKLNLNIELNDYIRQDKFWDRGESPYIDLYQQTGFVEVDKTSIRDHDVVLMKLGVTGLPNHGAVYVDSGYILHHVQNRLSEKTLYIKHWKNITTNVLRHTSLL